MSSGEKSKSKKDREKKGESIPGIYCQSFLESKPTLHLFFVFYALHFSIVLNGSQEGWSSITKSKI